MDVLPGIMLRISAAYVTRIRFASQGLSRGRRARALPVLVITGLLAACGGGGGGGGGGSGGTSEFVVTASASGSGSISPSTARVASGSTATFSVTPGSGSSIATVSGCGGTLTGSSYTTGSISSSCTVTATFSLNNYQVTASAGQGGSISPATQTVQHGSTVSFSVVPDAEGGIDTVIGCGGTLNGNTYTTGPITGNCAVSATFRLSGYQVAATAGPGGSISPAAQTVQPGNTASFTVIPNAGYGIDIVSGCGGTLSGSTYTTGPVTAACSVSAFFRVSQYSVTATAGPGGSITPSLVIVNEGQTESFNVSARTGYVIVSVDGCGGTGNGTDTQYTYTTAPIFAGCAINASFGVPAVAAVLGAEARDSAITLTWTDTGADHYNLYYSTDRDGCLTGRTCNYIPTVTSPYTLDELSNGTNYYLALQSAASGGTAISKFVGARPDKLIPNNEVTAIASATDGTSYIGGSFTHFGVRTGFGAPINIQTGHPGAFPIVNGPIAAVVADGNGGYYIGGDFTQVGDQVRLGLAHLQADMTVGAWSPSVSGSVTALAVYGDTIYFGGNFNAVDGLNRRNLAAVARDGLVLNWNPGANIETRAIVVLSDVVYLGGYFSEVAGASRRYLAAVRVDGTLLPWNPNPDCEVSALGASATSTPARIYIGGCFSIFQGQARSGLAAVNADATFTLSSWNPGVTGGQFGYPWINTLWVSDNPRRVYIGGDFSVVAGQPRNNLAAVDEDGSVSDWNPNPDGRVMGITKVAETVYFGGLFSSVGGVARQYLAAVNDSGELSSWSPAMNGYVGKLAFSPQPPNSDFAQEVYAGSYWNGFSSIGGVPRSGLAAIDLEGDLLEWSPLSNRRCGGGITAMATRADVVYVARGLAGIDDGSRASIGRIGTNGQFLGGERCADGDITSIAIDGDRLYIAGDFTRLDHPSDWRIEFPRDRLAAFRIDSGMSLTDWNPGADDAVLTLSAADGVVYAGGFFSTVANTTRNSVAAIDAAGNLLPWNPSLLPLQFGFVSALAVANSAVYMGGSFEFVNGVARQQLAAVDLEGQLLAWNPTLAGDRSVGYSPAMSISGASIYVAARWSGTWLKAIGIDGTIENWDPAVKYVVSALDVTQGRIVIGGLFHVVGGEVTGPIAVLER